MFGHTSETAGGYGRDGQLPSLASIKRENMFACSHSSACHQQVKVRREFGRARCIVKVKQSCSRTRLICLVSVKKFKVFLRSCTGKRLVPLGVLRYSNRTVS